MQAHGWMGFTCLSSRNCQNVPPSNVRLYSKASVTVACKKLLTAAYKKLFNLLKLLTRIIVGIIRWVRN